MRNIRECVLIKKTASETFILSVPKSNYDLKFIETFVTFVTTQKLTKLIGICHAILCHSFLFSFFFAILFHYFGDEYLIWSKLTKRCYVLLTSAVQ